MKNALAIEPASVPMKSSYRASKEDSQNRGECNSIYIDFTENGFETRVSFDPEKQPNEKTPYPRDEKLSWGDGAMPTKETVEKALAYVQGHMMKHVADEAAEEGGGKKAKAAKKAEAAEE